MNPLERIVETYIGHYGSLRAIAYSVVCNGEDADDIMQAVMTRLVERPEVVREVQAPLPFLRRCIRNEAISLYRKKKLAAIPFADEEQGGTFAFSDPGFDEYESLLYIKAYIKKQPDYVQQAFIEHVLDGEKIADIARRLGMKPDALERRFRQIKREIRQSKGALFTMAVLMLR